MPILKTGIPEHREYTQAERDAGILPAEDQRITSTEVNAITQAIDNNADVLASAPLLWIEGNQARHVYVIEGGKPAYYYAASATDEQIAAVTPGTDPAVWAAISLQGPAGQDGAQGPQGETGPQGPAGADGQDGAQGPVGADGVQGPPGCSDPGDLLPCSHSS